MRPNNADTPTTTQPIPKPPIDPIVGPLVGNALQIGVEAPVQAFMRLAAEYGPIYQIQLPGGSPIIVSSYALVNEICDQARFDKFIHAPLANIRDFAGDGLFTAYTEEPNWQKAHQILMPAFGMNAMRNYFPMMVEIADQLVAKWERLQPSDMGDGGEIDVVADMTRLTLDTIALCGFDYRFNSFYQEEMHPFIDGMVRSLREALERVQRLPLQHKLMFGKHRQYEQDIDDMNALVDAVIQERKASGADLTGKKDLLSLMLSGVEQTTGETLDDLNIRYQVITFLIAGHETTSGLLSFATYFLLKHPAVLAKAYAEVDRVLGSDLTVAPTYEQMHELRYLNQILKETLRVWPTAPAFSLYPHEDTVIGGQYHIPKGQDLIVLVPMLHRDPTVWGDNANLFDPERFTPEAEQARPANAYKPFGNGQRACIGRQFAMQEATLALAMILQRYRLIDHTDYQLKVKETLTLKPDGFKLKLRQRTAADRIAHASAPIALQATQTEPAHQITWTTAHAPQHHTPLLVLYGSNMGSSEELAQRITGDGEAQGYRTTVAALDEHVGRLPQEGGVVIVTSSYNGRPPDNAVRFCEWLETDEFAAACQGVRYTVFGCGNRDWASTFQAVPRLIDSKLAAAGATRLYVRGEADARDDFFGDFQSWYNPLWAALAAAFDLTDVEPTPATKAPLFQVEMVSTEHANPFIAGFGAQPMRILEQRELQNHGGDNPSTRSTRHIELALPADVTYQTGDHLGVIPRNPLPLVERVLARFGLGKDVVIQLRKTGSGKTSLPLDQPITALELLSTYVELQEVATQQQIETLAKYTECPPEKMKLLALAGEGATDNEAVKALYRVEVLTKRKSLLDLLEEYPACTLPFNLYLELLPALRPRYYSISSSPLHDPQRCTITVGVVDAPARSGRGQYRGVCSNYLAQQNAESEVYAFVRDNQSAFRLPADPQTPLIMVGPGTGLAPFRGFLQERALLKQQGQAVGPSLLFFGCRHAEQDFIYADELQAYADQGVTTLVTAFSRQDPAQKVYVQQRILEQKEAVWVLLEQGATIYVCGDASRMAPDVRRAFGTIYQEKMNADAATADNWLNELETKQRYLQDVWAAT
ncbi:MAG TPA: cytochrome P450 [Caldilineaceae bacterium]|nr:cytochrome P450 [Caldilineaceae bacterium]